VTTYVRRFLRGDFTVYDAELAALRHGVPTVPAAQRAPDTSADEVIGWAAMDSQNYPVAASRFEACWESTRTANLLEITALHGWHRAKALFLTGLQGDESARDRSFQVLDEAIRRGGQSSWFNRMRTSLLRARHDQDSGGQLASIEYGEALIRSFDDILERLGTTGDRYQRYVESISAKLASEHHGEYQEGLEILGKLLAFAATRPRYGTATDCRWRGVFGNTREVFAFEAKIEHNAAGRISATDIGQAHIQRERAEAEFGPLGFTVRGTIVTHLTIVRADAVSSLGPIKLIHKGDVIALWELIRGRLSTYRDSWSLDDVTIRSRAAATLRPLMPRAGWLVRAIDTGAPFVDASSLLTEWTHH
jgi:hypothetical protein